MGQHDGITGNKCQIPKGKVGQEWWANFPSSPHQFCLLLKAMSFTLTNKIPFRLYFFKMRILADYH